MSAGSERKLWEATVLLFLGYLGWRMMLKTRWVQLVVVMGSPCSSVQSLSLKILWHFMLPHHPSPCPLREGKGAEAGEKRQNFSTHQCAREGWILLGLMQFSRRQVQKLSAV